MVEEEEEEGEVNSKNLEREYNAFNETWGEGKNTETGGVNRESQEKSLNYANPKKATHSVVEDRERKDILVFPIKEGTHAITKDTIFLENTGVIFTGTLGSSFRPSLKIQNVEDLGSGSKYPTRMVQNRSSEQSSDYFHQMENFEILENMSDHQQSSDQHHKSDHQQSNDQHHNSDRNSGVLNGHQQSSGQQHNLNL
jgi:hypothetical protein